MATRTRTAITPREVQRSLARKTQKFAALLEAGDSVYTVVHNMSTRDVQVQVWEAADGGALVVPTLTRDDENTVTVDFGAATVADHRAVIIG